MEEMRLVDVNPILHSPILHTMKKKDVLEAIRTAPTVEVAPPTPGHWIVDHVDRFGFETLRCSVCGTVQSYGRTPYCPYCPAKMDGKEG